MISCILFQGKSQDKVCQLILTLAQSQLLHDAVIKALLTYINLYCTQLKTSATIFMHKPHVAENMYYVVSLLQQIIQTDILTDHMCVGTEVVERLLSDAIKLHGREPLLCEYIWQVCTLMKSQVRHEP